MSSPSSPQPGRRNLAAEMLSGALSLCKGLGVTWRNLWRKKATVNYPFPDPEMNYRPRPGYRGDFALLTDREKGGLRCTACMACVRACPDGCIHVQGEGKGKDRKPVQFSIDVGLCMFCHLCVEACPFDALTMTPDYEQAEDDPQKFIRNMEDLRVRGMEFTDVQRVE